jgi:hypothetical protein
MNTSGLMTEAEMKQEMLVEALEYYIYHLHKDNCNQAAIDAFSELLYEVENE